MYFKRCIGIAGPRALAAGLLAAAALSGCGGGGSAEATTSPRPESDPPHFRQASYDVRIFRGWPQDESDARVGNYLESAWHDPASSVTTIKIATRSSEGTGPPIANAEAARLQARELPGYRELGFKKVKLGGRPAIRWAFNLSGEGRVDYFFGECGTSFTVLGATPPQAFAALSESFEEMAATIKPVCE